MCVYVCVTESLFVPMFVTINVGVPLLECVLSEDKSTGTCNNTNKNNYINLMSS